MDTLCFNKTEDWQMNTEKISERAKYLLETGIWSDCKFIVGANPNKREFRTHKLIMSMASPVFEAMFRNDFQEKSKDITILDVQPDAFAALLTYIYTDDIKLQSFDQACELCYVANKYMMPILVKYCTKYIWKDVNHTNVCRAYEFAKLFDQNQLLDKCQKIICEETAEILSHPSFLDVEIQTLSMILDQQELNIRSEMELFTALQKWTTCEYHRKGIINDENKEEQRQIVEPLVAKIRFLLMSPQEFAEGPALTTLLTQSQSFAILMNISSNQSYPMPQGFSTEKKPRTSSRKISKFHYFTWDYDCQTIIKNMGTLSCTLNFNVDNDITLHGIQVVAQSYIQVKDRLFLDSDLNVPPFINELYTGRYKENMSMLIETDTNESLEPSVFKNIVEYGSSIDFLFNRPVFLSRSKCYKIVLILSQPGYYLKGRIKLNNCRNFNIGSTFNFLQPDSNELLDSYIHGLIYEIKNRY